MYLHIPPATFLSLEWLVLISLILDSKNQAKNCLNRAGMYVRNQCIIAVSSEFICTAIRI